MQDFIGFVEKVEFIGGSGSPVPPDPTSYLLKDDGASHLFKDDATSNLTKDS